MLKCIVVTPEQTVCEEPADFVALPLYDGELGVAVGHSPMIGRIGCGELRIKMAGKLTRFYVEGGFVEVLRNVVSVLTQRAVAADQLDAAVAAERLRAALARPAQGPEMMELRDRAVAQARAEQRVAQK